MADIIPIKKPEPDSRMLVQLTVEELREIIRAELQSNGHSREPTELLKLKEAAKRLNQSESWLYRRWKELGGKKQGGNIQFSATDIEKFITKRGA